MAERTMSIVEHDGCYRLHVVNPEVAPKTAADRALDKQWRIAAGRVRGADDDSKVVRFTMKERLTGPAVYEDALMVVETLEKPVVGRKPDQRGTL